MTATVQAQPDCVVISWGSAAVELVRAEAGLRVALAIEEGHVVELPLSPEGQATLAEWLRGP